MIFAACFELVMTHIFRRNKSDDVDMGYLGKITENVQKRLKPASFGADFLYDENIDHTAKKLKIAMLNETGFMVKLKM